ncbi:hypothetical protein ACKERJ_003584 [Providencia stuartii]
MCRRATLVRPLSYDVPAPINFSIDEHTASLALSHCSLSLLLCMLFWVPSKKTPIRVSKRSTSGRGFGTRGVVTESASAEAGCESASVEAGGSTGVLAVLARGPILSPTVVPCAGRITLLIDGQPQAT